jgi:hypothetical protein
MPMQGGMPFNPYMSMYGAPMGFGAPFSASFPPSRAHTRQDLTRAPSFLLQ